MDFYTIRIERSRGYYFEICFITDKFNVFVERGDHILVHELFTNEDEALNYFEEVYMEYTGEYLLD